MLSLTSNYAIRATGYLAALEKDKKADSSEISNATGVPRRFLLKILNDLKSSGILGATRGIGGGFWLIRSPKEISLYSVVSIFEDLQRFETCPLGSVGCQKGSKCPLHKDWVSVSSHFINFLKNSNFNSFKNQDITGFS